MRYLLNWRVLVLICAALVLIAGIDPKTKNALKVQHILKTIEKHQARPGGKALSAKVTENELNDYAWYRLAQEKSTLIRRVTIDLLDNDHVQGTVKFDARQMNLGFLFGEDLDFYFKGLLRTKEGAGRIAFDTLHMNGQPVKPQILNMVLSTTARYYGTEPIRIDDWQELPKGVKRISVKKDRALLFY